MYIWLCSGEQWLEARKSSSTDMHVLKPMALSIDLFQCMLASNDLPKYVLFVAKYMLYTVKTDHFINRQEVKVI